MEKNQRVLIVDDEARNQRIASEILEDHVECKCVSSGEEALRIMDEYRPHLVLLDIMMAGINGYEVCQKIRANTNLPFVKIILVSGKAMVEERLQGYTAGADDYMTKPFVPEELFAKANVFLRLAHAEMLTTELNRALEGQVEVQKVEIHDTKAKLIEAAKMAALGEMAGGVAHEINTPLSTIRLLVDFLNDALEDEYVDKKFMADKIAIIDKTVTRISKIVGGLRTFSRDGGKDQFEKVPLQKIIEDTLALCGEKFKYNSIAVEVSPFPDTLRLECRAVQVSQVLLNLLGNACDAVTPLPEKWIKIHVGTKNEMLQLSITDSGNGIPEDVQKKMFQPFFTTKEIGHGTGLGLSISRGIIEAHRGKMSVSTHDGHTRFLIELPLLQTTTTPSGKVP